MTYLAAVTILHTALSLVAIAAGAVVVAGLLRNRDDLRPTAFFLACAALASLTGYVFPFKGVTPAQVVGLLALAILALCWSARARSRASAFWRATYAAGLVASLYLLAFVGIVQAFKHLPMLNALAPHGNEPPFLAAQGAALILFAIIGVFATRRFRLSTSNGRA
jgi:hypothetical protein